MFQYCTCKLCIRFPHRNLRKLVTQQSGHKRPGTVGLWLQSLVMTTDMKKLLRSWTVRIQTLQRSEPPQMVLMMRRHHRRVSWMVLQCRPSCCFMSLLTESSDPTYVVFYLSRTTIQCSWSKWPHTANYYLNWTAASSDQVSFSKYQTADCGMMYLSYNAVRSKFQTPNYYALKTEKVSKIRYKSCHSQEALFFPEVNFHFLRHPSFIQGDSSVHFMKT